MNVRAAVTPLLEPSIHPHYTDHSVRHSEQIIGILGGLTDGLMQSDACLSPIELYVLLAASYLHDIGMQDSKSMGHDLDKIRELHHELTGRIILESVDRSQPSPSLGIVSDPDTAYAVALVAVGHREAVDLFDEKYDEFPHLLGALRPRLLAALLRFADELHLDHDRVDMERLHLEDVNPRSQVHWYRHYYVSGVQITDGYVTIAYRLPQGKEYDRYEAMIPRLVHPKLESVLAGVQTIFQQYGIGVTLTDSIVRSNPLVNTMPPDIEELAKEECRRSFDEEIGRLEQAKSKSLGLPWPSDPILEKIVDGE
jgi:hypothetical protein